MWQSPALGIDYQFKLQCNDRIKERFANYSFFIGECPALIKPYKASELMASWINSLQKRSKPKQMNVIINNVNGLIIIILCTTKID